MRQCRECNQTAGPDGLCYYHSKVEADLLTRMPGSYGGVTEHGSAPAARSNGHSTHASPYKQFYAVFDPASVTDDEIVSETIARARAAGFPPSDEIVINEHTLQVAGRILIAAVERRPD